MTPAVARAEITQIAVIGFRGTQTSGILAIKPEPSQSFERPTGVRRFWQSGCCCVWERAWAFRKASDCLLSPCFNFLCPFRIVFADRHGFTQGAVQFDMKFDHIARAIPAEDFEMLRFPAGLADDREAVRSGGLKRRPRIGLLQLVRSVMRFPGMSEEDWPRPVLCDAVNLQLRRLHVADQIDLVAFAKRNLFGARRSEIGKQLSLVRLNNEAMGEDVGHLTG
jgi:hypothetical protein